ncbi:MAG: trimethylamine methyltransferase family protein, partial [Anaerolineae bacterium]
MRPLFKVLDDDLIARIVAEGFELLMNPGVRVHNAEALELLAEAGADVNFELQVAHIPQDTVERSLETAPSEFLLYDLGGEPAVHYGGNTVQFDPGSAAITVLDSETQEQRAAVTADLVKLVKVVEALPQLDAQSTAMISADVAEEIGDLYRLYL